MEYLSKVLTIRVTEAEYQQLAQVAEAEERSIAQVARRYLRKGFETD